MIPWKCATCREKQPPLMLFHVHVDLAGARNSMWICRACRRRWQQPEIPRAEVRA